MFKINSIRRKHLLLVGVGLLATALLLIGVLHTLIFLGGQPPDLVPETDIVIVLGAGLRGDQLSLTLRYRMETALSYLQKYSQLKVIVSGGKGPGEIMTEAAAMRDFLIENGLDESRILLEDRSTSTYENLLYSRELVPEKAKSLVVTSDFHMFRALMLADHLGYNATGLPAPSVDFLRIKHYTREYLAIIKSIVIDIPRN
jgi:uncharacterized SAM-binding protein YcdF (DUF218 family)